MRKHKIIGLMSGTSLDGIDVAYCEFYFQKEKWEYKIIQAKTFDYPTEWKEKLRALPSANAEEIIHNHFDYGNYLGKTVKQFIMEYDLKPDIVASHGHTIFHQPEKGFTFQLGDGNAIANECGITCIADFRTKDVLNGGQGAPLVPIGDRLLFHNYDMCINLGGFSNCSFDKNQKRIAFDICPVNMALNYFANNLGFPYDNKGQEAKKGNINFDLVDDLNKLEFYQIKGPKSLGREWFETKFLDVLSKYKLDTQDILRSLIEHISSQIVSVIEFANAKKVLFTGGGARNTFLIEQIKEKTAAQVIVPDEVLIDFKEALVFAFLALLRWNNNTNCLASATGAKKDSSGGVIFYP